MSKREQQAKRRYEAAWKAAEADGFDMTPMPVGEPRATARKASALADHYERTVRRPQHRLSKRDAESSRDVMRALASAAQSYADHHERAEQERRRQRQAGGEVVNG